MSEKTGGGFAILKWAYRFAIVIILTGSLALNADALVGGALFTGASGAFETVTGTASLFTRNTDEIVRLQAEIATKTRVERELRGQVAELTEEVVTSQSANRRLRESVTDLDGKLAAAADETRLARVQATDLAGELSTQRAANRQLRTQGTERLVEFRGTRMALGEAVEQTSDSISMRARNSAARELGAMAGEVFVVDADGRRIPWKDVSHIDEDEMRNLMREIVNRLYTFHLEADDPTLQTQIER
jgi:hypothetical protein